MVGVIVEVVCHGTERTALRGPTGPAHPGRTDTAHTEFVICDESIEQDHRFVKRRVNSGLGFGSFRTAQRTLQGYEAMHIIRKGQIEGIAKGDVLAQNRVLAQVFGVAA
jgi:IS6 family transposase